MENIVITLDTTMTRPDAEILAEFLHEMLELMHIEGVVSFVIAEDNKEDETV